MPRNPITSPENNLREFLANEIPSMSETALDSLMLDIELARRKYSKYEKGSRAAAKKFNYLQQRTACHNIAKNIERVLGSLEEADLMVTDDLGDYLGDPNFKSKLSGKLIEIQKACNLIHENYPYTGQGNQFNRVLYSWVIDMARIYESVFKPKLADHRKNGKFTHFLKCWTPDEFLPYGDPLSPRTVKRVLKHMRARKTPQIITLS